LDWCDFRYSAAVNGAVIADSAIDGLVAINSASKFGNVAGGLSKAAPVLNVAIGFAKVNEGYAMDGGKIGVNTKLAAGTFAQRKSRLRRAGL
jgi:hypothetical protein